MFNCYILNNPNNKNFYDFILFNTILVISINPIITIIVSLLFLQTEIQIQPKHSLFTFTNKYSNTEVGLIYVLGNSQPSSSMIAISYCSRFIVLLLCVSQDSTCFEAIE